MSKKGEHTNEVKRTKTGQGTAIIGQYYDFSLILNINQNLARKKTCFFFLFLFVFIKETLCTLVLLYKFVG